MGETWFEIANIYAWLPLLPQQKQKSFMPREKQKHGLKWQSVINNFFYFKNENKNHLFQENGENMEWNNKVWRITCPASRTKTEVIYVMEIAETWIKMINCYEELPLFPLRKQVICVKKMQETWTEIAMGYESIPMLPERKQVIYVKKTGEVWTERAKCYEWLPLLPERKQESFMSRKWEKHGLK